MTTEALLINAFFTYYPQNSSQSTALAPYEATAWANTTYPDTGYYRALLNNVVAGVIQIYNYDHDHLPPGADANVSLARLSDLFTRVLHHYSTGPAGQSGGWGYYVPDSNPARQLTDHSEFMGAPLTLATALLWPSLDPIQRAAARTILLDFATRLLACRTQSHYSAIQSIGNTASEEASACAAFFALLAGFYPSHPSATSWLARAKLLFTWAYQNAFLRRIVPPNDRNAHPANYAGTLANHNMFPHPLYGFSLLTESALAALPWAATGRTDLFHQSLAGLYGSSAAVAYLVYAANVFFLQGATAQGNLPPNPTLKLRGYTYPADKLSWTGPAPTPLGFADQRYNCPGVTLPAGCADWGQGLEFQNAAFALASWLDESYYPSLGLGYYNYQKVLASQGVQAGYGYLPTRYLARQWSWHYLPSTLSGQQPTDGTRMLLNFFLPANSFPPLTLAGQINTHYFLNSYSAFNHAVSWLLHSNYWSQSDHPLPNFATL